MNVFGLTLAMHEKNAAFSFISKWLLLRNSVEKDAEKEMQSLPGKKDESGSTVTVTQNDVLNFIPSSHNNRDEKKKSA